MNVPFVEEEEKSLQNVIALHLNIKAPEPSSFVVTGNVSNAGNHRSNMLHPIYSSKRINNMNRRIRSASVGRDKKSDLRARYWAFLFEYLHHAIDELYQTCETGENISECKEVILVLENYIRDFHNLAEWFRVKWEYENTPPPHRPNSLAWEIRKSSPGKLFRKSCQPKLDSSVCRELIFELNDHPPLTESSSVSNNDKLDSLNANIDNCVLSESSVYADSISKISSSTVNQVLPLPQQKSEKDENMKTKLNKSVDCASQTDEFVPSSLSTLTGSKKPGATVSRKISSNDISYPKKIFRNFSISAAPEKNTPIPLMLTTKRMSGYISPRKPTPGQNVAAPPFVPGRKINANVTPTKSCILPSTERPLLIPSTDASKIKIPRSQSDSSFETCVSAASKTNLQKSYASDECVKSNDTKDETSSKFSSVVSMEVISEALAVENKIDAVQLCNNDTTVGGNVNTLHVVHRDISDKKNNKISNMKKAADHLLEIDAKLAVGDTKVGIKSQLVDITEKKLENEIMGDYAGDAKNKCINDVDSISPVTTYTENLDIKISNNSTLVPGSNEENSLPIVVLHDDKKNNIFDIESALTNDIRITELNRKEIGDAPVIEQTCDKENKLGYETLTFGQSVNEKSNCDDKSVTNIIVTTKKKTETPKIATSRPEVINRTLYNNQCDSKIQKATADTVNQFSNKKSNCFVKSAVEFRRRTSQALYMKECKTVAVKQNDNVKATAVNCINVRRQLNVNKSVKSKLSATVNKTDTKTSYMNVSKSNIINKETIAYDPRHYPKHSSKIVGNIIRSKTSVDMKLNKRSLPVSSSLLDNTHTKTVSEERDLLPRNRRSSKDSDGWETVISRSRRSIPNSLNGKPKPFDINRRFYEPTPSASLPTLTCIEVTNTNELNREKSSLDSKKFESSKNGKNRNRNSNHNNNSICKEIVTVDNNVLDDVKDAYKLNNERPIISSTAMFTTIQPKRRKQANSNYSVFEKESKKGKLNHKEGRLMHRKSKENEQQQLSEDLLSEESLRKSKELHEKEISLQKELNDLQNSVEETEDTEIDSDSTEMDQEIVALNKENDQEKRRAVLEAAYNHILAKMSWGDQVQTLDKLEELLKRDPSGRSLKFVRNFTNLQQLEDLVSRAPGRALELHQKLSSPSRKRVNPDSTILHHEARQAKAKQNREQLWLGKSAKIKEINNKISEVKAMQAQLADDRRKLLDQKLKRAEENRNLHLKNIQEKAHDEAKKQKEIAFINELESQNKRHDFITLCQEQEDRLQSILEERQKRHEEKAAKDAAVEERRKAIEAGKQEKIEVLQEKIRKKKERIDREQQEKERERIKVAREKARDREDRLLALHAAQIANAEELQKKIQQKQEDSARRHEENIEQKRQRAIKIGTPRLTPYQVNKFCSVCNVVIDSEVFLLSHLRGKTHLEAVKKYREQFEASVKFTECSIIKDAPADMVNKKKSREKERKKTLRKRCKKIRHRLTVRSENYMKNVSLEKDKTKRIDSSNKGRILKSIKEIEKLISSQGNGSWPDNAVTMLERNLFEINRVFDKGNKNDQIMFREFDGFTVLSKIYDLALDLPKNMSPYLPLKCFILMSNLFTTACKNNVENCIHILLSNSIVQILDLLLNRLNLIMPNNDDRNGMIVYKADTLADSLMNLSSIILTNVSSLTKETSDTISDIISIDITQHVQDIVSYIVCTGIVDKLAVYCSSVHDDKSTDSYFLLHCIQLLTRLVETRRGKITDKEDCTQLMATLKATELVGAVSMLYAMLLHRDSMANNVQYSVTVLQTDVVNVIIATLQLFSRVGELNLKFFQDALGAEGISLQVRHIISYLLRYCVQNNGYKDLLHQVIEFIGFFAINHHDNQMILQSGSTPTVLQQLSNLPFPYFSEPSLLRILFPTLLACCVNNAQNRKIIDQELSFQSLEEFMNSPDSQDIPLIRLLKF